MYNSREVLVNTFSFNNLHNPYVKVAHAVRVKGDLFSIGAPAGEYIPGQVVGQSPHAASIGLYQKKLGVSHTPGAEKDLTAIRTPTG